MVQGDIIQQYQNHKVRSRVAGCNPEICAALFNCLYAVETVDAVITAGD